VSVRTTGCSGLAYVLEYVDEERAHDHVFPFAENQAVYIDPKAFEYLKGTTLDYVKKGLNEGFEFINPNESGRCGCGESFNV
jgi:iron-sulfur cluster assembly protein